MSEWICLKCHKVFHANSFSCCGEGEIFDPAKHGALLVSHSNAWINVFNRWRGHPLWKEVSQELAREGCYSASQVFNEFITQLGGEE